MKIGNSHCRTQSNDVTFIHNNKYFCICADYINYNKSALYNIKKKVINDKIDYSKINHRNIIITLKENKTLIIEKL